MKIDKFRQALKDGAAPADVKLRKQFAATVKADGEGDDAPILFTITTSAPDRMGDVVEPKGGRVDNYTKNPVVLWAHDASQPPVAKSVEIIPVENGWQSRAEFASRDLYPFGHMIGQMYRQGFMSAVSIGFRALRTAINEERPGFCPLDFLDWELLEYSAVPIPANPEALVAAKAAGIDTAPLVAWAEKLLDTAGPRDPAVAAAWRTAKGSRLYTFKRGDLEVSAPTAKGLAKALALVKPDAPSAAPTIETAPAPAMPSPDDVAKAIAEAFKSAT
jgi:hypothetical protein